ncbi:hypothetical protein H0H92_000010 [Tricholoma furcatifolium]|nr:hypothetical protein H0H92_000010 [Tricholoma furcatifolium]
MSSSLYDAFRVGPNPSTQLAQSTPYQLRAIVLDYLAHEGYSKTAAVFARDSTVRHLDPDGDEIMVSPDLPEGELLQIELRKQIYHHIQCGHVDDAIALLNAHFPSVLNGPISDPPPPPTPGGPRRISDVITYTCSTSTHHKHLSLNLRILTFVEACRTRPLPYPPRDESSLEVNEVDDKKQIALLNMAQKLLVQAQMLPTPAEREIYLKELNNVGSLLAYKVPENSSMRKYLAQERRDAVANQINQAILKREGIASASSLELLVRYTATLWHFANKLDVKPRPGATLPPAPPSSPTKETEAVPTFDLGLFLDHKS